MARRANFMPSFAAAVAIMAAASASAASSKPQPTDDVTFARPAADATRAGVAIARSGIEGQVVVGPINPVEHAGTVNHRPFETTVLVLDQHGDAVTRVRTDVDGHFRANLETGTYTVRPEIKGLSFGDQRRKP